MSELDGYSGKWALVTGAGDGIGRMLAEKLSAAGMNLIVQDIRQEAADAVVTSLAGTALSLVFDVSDRDACMHAAQTLKDKGISLNLVWLNAGVGVGSPILGGKPNAVEWAYSVNVLGIIWTAQAFIPLMDEAEGPRHVGVTASSASLTAPDGAFPLYAATKHGTMAVGEALRGELSEKGIDTTLLCPGLLNTEIWDGAKARPERFGGARNMDPSVSGQWREAKTPDVMWPYIAGAIEDGGGYLTCMTEERTLEQFEARVDAFKTGIVTV